MSDLAFADRYVDQRVRVERDAFTRKTAVDAILRREVLITQLAGTVGRRAAAQDAFTEAARQAMRLSHPNIVATWDTDSANGYPFVIQEHLPSESLRSIIDAEGPFHPDDVAILISSLADALSYARLRGMPHLALDPECIQVDFDGTVLITDFGIGSVLVDLEPSVGRPTPYRAPERTDQFAGDGRSDIFSAGIIAWEMLAGDVPAIAEDGRVPALVQVNPSVPPDVSAIVAMAVDIAPERRFRTIEAFAAALDDWRVRTSVPVVMEEPAPQFRHLDPESDSVPDEPDQVLPEMDAGEPGDEEPESSAGTLTAVLAWCGLAIGVLALGWVLYSFLDGDDAPGGSPDITRVAGGPDLATATVAVATVPNLVGMTLSEASAALGTPVTASGSRNVPDATPGTILEQNPPAGTAIDGSGVSVVLASDESVDVLAGIEPRGMTFEALSLDLTQRGLNVVRLEEGSTSVPEGQVISIDQRQAAPGDTVTVRVSMGNRVQIPLTLQSAPLDDVTLDLEDMGLTIGEPIPVSADVISGSGVDLEEFSIEDGDVVGFQEDAAGFGRWVPAGSTVTPVYYDESLP